jgi:hypothetical protein
MFPLQWLLVTLKDRTNRPMQLRPFTDLLCLPFEFESFPIYPLEFSALDAAETPSSEAGRNFARNIRKFCLQVSLFTPVCFLTCRKILRHWADGFIFPPKEVMLRFVIVFKTPLPSAGLESANVASNGKHDNHYTTDNDFHYSDKRNTQKGQRL